MLVPYMRTYTLKHPKVYILEQKVKQSNLQANDYYNIK